MRKGVIYARVSTEEQAKEGQSIDAQLKMCRDYAKNGLIETIEVFVDEGKSATNMNRPALQDMLALCQDKSQQIEVVLVQDTDRLARNTFDHLKIKALLKKRNIQLVAINQPLIDDSPEGNLIDTMLAATNAFQSQITGRKTSKVLEQKALIGWFPGGTPPLGYRNADNPATTSNIDRRIIVIDEEVAPYIKEVFERYVRGDTSAVELAGYLTEHGIKSPLAKSKIHASLVNLMLHNDFYIGKFSWNGKKYDGKHEPLVSVDLYDRVQDMIAVNNQMWGEVREKNGQEFRYYYCKKKGKGSYISATTLEGQVDDIFRQIEISKEYKDQIMETARRLLRESRDSREDERQRLIREKAKYAKAISEAEDDRYIRNIISSEALMRVIDKYKPLLEKVNQDLAALDVDHGERLEALERILKLAENIGDAYAKANDTLKKEYLQLFFDKFWVEDEKIVKYEVTPDLKGLIEVGSVRVSSTGLPDLDSNQEPFR